MVLVVLLLDIKRLKSLPRVIFLALIGSEGSEMNFNDIVHFYAWWKIEGIEVRGFCV